jgi:hypothetical protein
MVLVKYPAPRRNRHGDNADGVLGETGRDRDEKLKNLPIVTKYNY